MSYNIVFKTKSKKNAFGQNKKGCNKKSNIFRGKQLPLNMIKEFIYNSYLSEANRKVL